MMKWFGAAFLISWMTLYSCNALFLDEDAENSPQMNFDYLWNDLNNRYSFMEYKGLNWQEIRSTYEAGIQDGMSDEALFDVLAGMINELRDGHANLMAPFNQSNYYPIFLESPVNYDSRLVLEHYLLRNPAAYYVTGSLPNALLDTLGVKVGYIRYASFSNYLQSADMDYVISRFLENGVNGIIIDVRSNGGGDVGNVFQLANSFTDEERLVYTSQMKTGPGPDDFGDDLDVYLQPSGLSRFTGRVAVLTNRSSYSATSLFALAMRSLPQVRIVGDSTGGGLGAPTFAELPNGWSYRFSVTRTLSPQGDNWEDGIPPHILMDLDEAATQAGFDSIIERAIEYIIYGE